MKDSESIGRSSKKANGKIATKLSQNPRCSSSLSIKSNGSIESKSENKRTKKTKAMMGAGSSNNKNSSSTSSGSISKTSPASNSIKLNSKKVSPGRKGKKESPELRPRRRASQTYFFKYQLAKNPLKAEEEDLRLALLASLQQCGNGNSTESNGSSKSKSNNDKPLKDKKSTKQNAHKDSIHLSSEPKRPAKRPTSGTISPSSVENDSEETNSTIITASATTPSKKKQKFPPSKKGQHFKISSNGTKRRGSVESAASSKGSSFKETEKTNSKKKKLDRRRENLLVGLQTGRDLKTEKSRKHAKSSLTSCNDLTSVQNKIKKAKRLLQNKQANKVKSNDIIGKYSALRKFPLNSALSTSTKKQGASLLSPTKSSEKSKKSKSKTDSCHSTNNNLFTANLNTTSGNNYFTPYSPYTPLQRKEPPDEDYLKKYKPETEDFLTFICFRTTAPNYHRSMNDQGTNGVDSEATNCTTTTTITTNGMITGNTIKIIDRQGPNDHQNLKQCTSSLTNNKLTNINHSPTSVDLLHSPNNHRRPTRQSPRLASSNRKISENETSNQNMGTSSAAYDNSITYEEDMKRASIALEDMAQEINSSDDINNEIAQNSSDCISNLSSSPYRNNKHLVKGLMTREFAGAFADEETIFESISNHKL